MQNLDEVKASVKMTALVPHNYHTLVFQTKAHCRRRRHRRRLCRRHRRCHQQRRGVVAKLGIVITECGIVAKRGIVGSVQQAWCCRQEAWHCRQRGVVTKLGVFTERLQACRCRHRACAKRRGIIAEIWVITLAWHCCCQACTEWCGVVAGQCGAVAQVWRRRRHR